MAEQELKKEIKGHKDGESCVSGGFHWIMERSKGEESVDEKTEDRGKTLLPIGAIITLFQFPLYVSKSKPSHR